MMVISCGLLIFDSVAGGNVKLLESLPRVHPSHDHLSLHRACKYSLLPFHRYILGSRRYAYEAAVAECTLVVSRSSIDSRKTRYDREHGRLFRGVCRVFFFGWLENPGLRGG
ncbi:hypothetical protein BZA05DRAFT_401625 [Tricharina praecox]|uniref:uncharacterized protein n=1 Tax=Tricharina praecox TaxID=43433 RepID=UPI0022205766|nr:uncharacterized protein BZA05DRAFT_401625 [Tricharina praecox]KAI5849809.1 hypothetical protein BZA05DRAFT_401625 [Tricharina praecox]